MPPDSKSSCVMGKGKGIVSEKLIDFIDNIGERSEYKIQKPCSFDTSQFDKICIYLQTHKGFPYFSMIKRINERIASSVDKTSEDIKHGAALPSSTYSPKHDEKGALNASAEKWNRFHGFEEYLRTFYQYQLIKAHYHTCHSLNEIYSVHFEEKPTGHKPSGKQTAKKFLLRLRGNIAGRRHEICHILKKFFDLDVWFSQSSQQMLSEMDLAYDSKLEKLWRDLEAALPFLTHRYFFDEKASGNRLTKEGEMRHPGECFESLPFLTHRDFFEEKASGNRLREEEEMKYEGLRLRSFHGVDMNVSYLRLAAAGFYSTKNGDETRCFSCGIRHKNWQRGDNPFVVHTHRSPTCKHLLGRDARNVPIQLLNSSVNQPSVDRDHQNTQQPEPSRNAGQDDVQGATGTTRNCTDVYRVSQPFPAQLSPLSTRDSDEVAPVLSFDGSVHPHYSSTASRLESFKLWPEGHSQRPEELAKAGFFYAGYADCVRCFVCGVGLRTWEEGDDPWTEHVRWRSSCAYVEAVRGKRFIMQTLAALGRSLQAIPKADRNQQASSSNNTNRSNEGDDILRNAACAQAVKMGFSREEVKAAARATLNLAGKSSLTLDELLETILVTDGEVSEQPATALPTEREVPGRAQVNIDTTREVSRITEITESRITESIMTDNAEERRRSSDHQRNQALQRLPRDKDSTSVTTSEGTALTSSSLITKKEEEDKDSLTSNPQRKEFIVTGRRTSPRTNVFYNDNESTSAQAASYIDTTTSLGTNNHGRNRENRPMGAAVLSMPTERQRTENIDNIKNKSQHKGKSKEDLEATLEETRQLKESSACKICLEDPANIVFLPCGHLVACAMCAPALERCPVCRTHIRGTVRVHMASLEKYISSI